MKKTREQLRDEGMVKAMHSANQANAKWTLMAYAFLIKYAEKHEKFMLEDAREASINRIPQPPNNRAWGGIIIKAVNADIIVKQGFASVKNKKAHCTPASVWQSQIYKP